MLKQVVKANGILKTVEGMMNMDKLSMIIKEARSMGR